MSTRHEAREWALQFIFQRDFNREDFELAITDFWALKDDRPKVRAFAAELIKGVESHWDELDKLIQGYAENWDLNRMGALDRAVIRLALYEMHFRPDIPPVVSINEAVDLAKAYSSRESGRFVNGILDEARKDITRPARTAVEKIPPRQKDAS